MAPEPTNTVLDARTGGANHHGPSESNLMKPHDHAPVARLPGTDCRGRRRRSADAVVGDLILAPLDGLAGACRPGWYRRGWDEY